MRYRLTLPFFIIISLVMSFSFSQSLRDIDNYKVDVSVEIANEMAETIGLVFKTKTKIKSKSESNFTFYDFVFQTSLFVFKPIRNQSVDLRKIIFISASCIYNFTSDSGPPQA